MKIAIVIKVVLIAIAAFVIHLLVKNRKTVKKNSKKLYKSVKRTGKRASKRVIRTAKKVRKYYAKAV
jgi:hypothetical protein